MIFSNFFICNIFKISIFWYVLPHKTISVFTKTSLPRTIRMSKENWYSIFSTIPYNLLNRPLFLTDIFNNKNFFFSKFTFFSKTFFILTCPTRLTCLTCPTCPTRLTCPTSPTHLKPPSLPSPLKPPINKLTNYPYLCEVIKARSHSFSPNVKRTMSEQLAKNKRTISEE